MVTPSYSQFSETLFAERETKNNKCINYRHNNSFRCDWTACEPPPSQWKFGSIFTAITTAINHSIVVHFVIFHPHSTAFLPCSNSSTNDVSDPKTSSSTIQFPFGASERQKSRRSTSSRRRWKSPVIWVKLSNSKFEYVLLLPLPLFCFIARAPIIFSLLWVPPPFEFVVSIGGKINLLFNNIFICEQRKTKNLAAFKSEFNFVESTGWMAISTPLFFIHSKCSNSIVPFSCAFCCCDR